MINNRDVRVNNSVKINMESTRFYKPINQKLDLGNPAFESSSAYGIK